MPYTVLVTGAGSGLGYGFAQHYLRQPDTIVITADRTYRHDHDLETPSSKDTQLHKLTFDMSLESSLESLVTTTKQFSYGKLDLVIHSAGIRGLVPTVEDQYPGDVQAAETLNVMTTDTLMRTFQINTAGTFTLLQKLHEADLFHRPSDSASDSSSSSSSSSPGPTKVILMTSRMGSIGYNTAGGSYAYRASKAALNAIVRSMSIDVPHVCFALVHPGRVETGLTKCREEGAIEVEESVRDMLRLIGGLETERSGRFMDRFGKEIEW